MSSIQKKIATLPNTPGVYFFLGARKRILYIGKAGSLRDRVRSYFSKDIFLTRGAGIEAMLREAKDVDYQKTDSVLEAVILEAALIRKHRPKYNVREKDDKSFNYVAVTDEEYPRVLLIRGRELQTNKDNKLESYKFTPRALSPSGLKARYGPFPQAGVLKEALGIVRKIFPYRDKCTPLQHSDILANVRMSVTKKFRTHRASLQHSNILQNVGMLSGGKAGKPCFSRQVGLCPGVCTGEISKKEYQKTIRNIQLLFEGRKGALLKKLEREMKQAAKKQEFEKAAELRNTISALKHIHDISLLKRNSKFKIQNSNFRMEAYDIAHTAGQEMVGVMTVLENGEPQKSEYRKFKLKTVHSVNDPAALKEILERRLKHSEWPRPDLVVVDGGKAQINTASRIIEGRPMSSHFKIEIVGVVKDEHHRPKRIEGDRETIRRYEREILLANAEAHRFALAFHRRRRGHTLNPSKR